MMKRFVLAITGSSAPILGVRLAAELVKHHELHLVISKGAIGILRHESHMDWEDTARAAREHLGASDSTLKIWDEHDLAAPISSGSFKTDGMFVVPCSMKSLAGIASGYAENLIQRAADVTIKEGRRLVISPREMPLSPIHIENMLKLSRIGVTIAPPIPAFYHEPISLDDMLDFFTGKLMDAMGLEHSLYPRWGT